MYEEALRFNNDVRLCEVGRTAGTRAARMSLLTISATRLIVSCVKESGGREPNTYVVRLYNPADAAERATVEFFAPIVNAEQVTLEEQTVAPVALTSAHGFTVEAGPRKIVTVKFTTVGVNETPE